jgi:hypothetical protein
MAQRRRYRTGNNVGWPPGLPKSEDTKARISLTMTGMKRGPMSDEHKRRISEACALPKLRQAKSERS